MVDFIYLFMEERENLDLAEDRFYEVGFLVREETNDPVKNILQKSKAAVYEEGPLTKVALAYPIKKEKLAFFGYCRFSGSPDAAAAIQEALKFEPAVLRTIFIKLSSNASKTPKAMPAEDRRMLRRREVEPRKEGAENGLSNEDLEKKIEEILAN